MPRQKSTRPKPKRDLITVDLGAAELLHLDHLVQQLNTNRRDYGHFRAKRYTRSEVLRLAVHGMHRLAVNGQLPHDGQF